MTKRLYLDDSYLLSCQASVLACEKNGESWRVLLNQTVLFPEGGGQPADTGHIGSAEVIDVQEEGENVWHTVRGPLNVGDEYSVTVDWERRFDHMQQHTGEHLLSFSASKLFGAHNVGFHMSANYCTADFDIPLSAEQVEAVEEETNRLIMRNLPVTLQYVTQEELDRLTLRKKAKELEGAIRIVWIEDADSCTCCGTHTAVSSEAGPVCITAVEKHKEGVRVTFLCGMRAVRHMRFLQNTVDHVARLFSVSVQDAAEAVENMKDECGLLKRDIRRRDGKLAQYVSSELWENAKISAGARIAVKLLEETEASQLKQIAQSICMHEKTVAVLFVRDGEYVQYTVACSKGAQPDAGEICQTVNAVLNGKGGGRGELAQGRAVAGTGLAEAVEQIESYLCARLKG